MNCKRAPLYKFWLVCKNYKYLWDVWCSRHIFFVRSWLSAIKITPIWVISGLLSINSKWTFGVHWMYWMYWKYLAVSHYKGILWRLFIKGHLEIFGLGIKIRHTIKGETYTSYLTLINIGHIMSTDNN